MKKLLLALLFALPCMFLSNRMLAQVPGTLDSTFASNGVQILTPSTGFDNAYSVVLLDDGKMLIGGASEIGGGSWDVCVYRLNQDGSIDSTFATDGFAFADYMGYNQYVRKMIRLENGKLLFAGGIEDDNFQVDVFATQLNEDGTVDTTFGDNGTMVIHVDDGEDIANAAVEQPDGKIILVGNTQLPGFVYSNSVAIRLNMNGSIDEGYGNNGIVIVDVGFDYESANAAMLTDDGGVLATGYVGNMHDDLLAFKLDAFGNLDPAFDLNGIATYILNNGDDIGYSILKSPYDGKILIGGKIGSGSTKSDFLVMAIDETGKLDTSFGNNGLNQINIKNSDVGISLAVQANGRIVLGGTAGQGFATNDFAICRFNADGSIDSTFGTNGYTLSEISSFFSEIDGVAIQQDGKIVAAGIAASFNNDMGVVRYKGDDVATGIATAAVNDSQFHIYPNPSNGNFNIEINDPSRYSGNAVLKLYDLSGRLIWHETAAMNNGALNATLHVSNTSSPGMYLLNAFYANKSCRQILLLQ